MTCHAQTVAPNRHSGIAAVLALLLLLPAAVLAADVSECPLPPPEPMPNEVAGVPVPDGQIEAAVSAIDGLADTLMQTSGIPGMAVAVVHNGRTVYAKGFGVRHLGKPDKVDADTVFLLASVSKSVGATVVARQVGKGVVRWDTPVHELLPEFELSDPWVTEHVTIGDLYAHRSGLPDHAGDYVEAFGYSQPQILHRLRLLSLSPFRAHYAYTNFGLTVAALATANAAQEDWASLSRNELYLPLGMNSTSSRYVDFEASSNRADPHSRINGRFVPSARNPHDAQSPAGGVSSSVNDLSRWMALLLGEGTLDGEVLVERCALLAALSPQMVSAPPLRPQARVGSYGYGFNVSDTPTGRTTQSHSGAFFGVATAFTLMPSLDLGIVTLTNGPPIGVAETLNAQFLDLAQFGEPNQDWATLYPEAVKPVLAPTGDLLDKPRPTRPAAARPLADYVGQYRNRYYGEAEVEIVRGGLVLSLGPTAQRLALRHWDGDVWTMVPPNESEPPGSLSKVVFGLDTLWIEYLNDEFPATWVRRKPR